GDGHVQADHDARGEVDGAEEPKAGTLIVVHEVAQEGEVVARGLGVWSVGHGRVSFAAARSTSAPGSAMSSSMASPGVATSVGTPGAAAMATAARNQPSATASRESRRIRRKLTSEAAPRNTNTRAG